MRNYLLPVIGLWTVCQSSVAVERQTGVDEQSQLPYWQISDQGMSLRLVQRLPAQTRGFFLARGFTAEQAERIAQSCVFQTVFKNVSHDTASPSPLSYDLRDWVVTYAGQPQGMKVREDWAKEWQAEKVSKPVQLAFEWSLYPTQQEYKPGDYNWGMSIFNLMPDAEFDLKIVWRQFGETRHETIEKMKCAADIELPPAEPF